MEPKVNLGIFLEQRVKIIVIDGTDIEGILDCKDVSAKFDEKYIDMYK